jgi:ribosomal protein S18 acetylase RimI-like enzyme
MALDEITIRRAKANDLERLQEIRASAFAPVFASFRDILGKEIYELAQVHKDRAQAEYLDGLFKAESPWVVYSADIAGNPVGFVSIRLDEEMGIGEIGLNAVDPSHAGKGIGTRMYQFAVQRMIDAGMKVATVSTGGDPSHAPARRAYRKAGFCVEIPSVWMCQKL